MIIKVCFVLNFQYSALGKRSETDRGFLTMSVYLYKTILIRVVSEVLIFALEMHFKNSDTFI